MAQLKDGSTPLDARLDRLVEFDERSRAFTIGEAMVNGQEIGLKNPRSFTWSNPFWLDQGRQGRCVEYSICHDLLARPVPVDPRFVTDILAGKKIYWPAQRDDQYPGGTYPGAVPQSEGTSVLQGVHTAAELGFYGEYRWAFTLQEAILALGYFGPLLLGVNWYEGMFHPDALGFLKPTGRLAGGHAILAHAVKIVLTTPRAGSTWPNVDLDLSYIVLHNSWGQGWGLNGRAKLSLRDFDRLRLEDGEVCIPSVRKKSVLFPVKDLMAA